MSLRDVSPEALAAALFEARVGRPPQPETINLEVYQVRVRQARKALEILIEEEERSGPPPLSEVFSVGDRLQSRDLRDGDRTVVVIEVEEDRIRVRSDLYERGRRTWLSRKTLDRWKRL